MAHIIKKQKESLRGLNPKELGEKLNDLRQKRRALRFKLEGAKSKNVKESMLLRRHIARVLTEIKNRK